MVLNAQNEIVTGASQAPVILALESASDASSAALRLPSGEVIQNLVEARHGHVERLTLQIADVLRQANYSFADITHIAAGCGPGSFTGIRVCLAAATGLLLAGTAQAVGISMLDALLHSKSGTDSQTSRLAILDSRRNTIYALQSGSTQIQDWDEAQLHKRLHSKPDISLTGLLPDGWDMRLPPHTHFQRRLPAAEMVAELAAEHILTNRALAPLEPAYLAPPKLGPSKKQS